MEKKEVKKVMTGKLPWIAAALIVVATVGTWAIYGGAPPTTPTGAWNQVESWSSGPITLTPGTSIVFAAPTPTTSGIENVFFMNHGFGEDADDNLMHSQATGYHENENIYEYNDNDQVLRASTDSVTIIADNAFDIVVIYKIHSTECVDPTDTSKFYVSLRTSSALSISEDDNSVAKHCFDNDGTGTTWGRWAAVFNGGGNGYQISTGTINIDNVSLYCWK